MYSTVGAAHLSTHVMHILTAEVQAELLLDLHQHLGQVRPLRDVVDACQWYITQHSTEQVNTVVRTSCRHQELRKRYYSKRAS